MKRIVLALLLSCVTLLGGCTDERIEKSTVLTEKAVVADLVYTPAVHGSGVGPTISMKGKVGLAFTNVDISEAYAVVFQCDHGKFIINDPTKAKRLWQTLKKDQEVVVSYREVYLATYDGDKLLQRRLEKYEFLDAT
jgi:hypothetical protein